MSSFLVLQLLQLRFNTSVYIYMYVSIFVSLLQTGLAYLV